LGVDAAAGRKAADAAEPYSRRQIALAAGWAAPAFVLLPCLALLPSDLFHDPESYLGVHSFMEAFACAVSVLVFSVGWYSARAERSAHLAVLSAAFLATALLDLAHLLSYQGMPPLVTPAGPEKAIDFWLGARYAEAGGLLLFALLPAAWRIGDRRYYAFIALSLTYTALVSWGVLFHPDALPRTFLSDAGLTRFKVAAEYGVVALHAATMAALLARPAGSLNFPVPTLFAALLVLVAGELAVTAYASVNDTYNFIGHVYKVIGFFLIYRAVFVQGVSLPYTMRTASERLYRQLTEQAADAIFKFDRSGKIVTANPRAEQLTGRRRDEMTSAKLDDIFDGRDGERLISRIDTLSPGASLVLEARVRRCDGGVVPAEISIGRLDEGGGLAIARDVSERKRLEEAIRIRDISFSSSILPIAMADLEGRVSYANRAFLDLWGYAEEDDVLGLGISDFLEDPAGAAEIIGALRSKGRWNQEIRLKRRDGGVMDVQVASNMVFDDDGRPICMIGSFKDVTEQKRMLTALRRNEELLRAAAQAAQIGIYDHDHRSDVIYWSPEQRANYGVAPDEVITLDFFVSHVHPDDRERIAAAVRHAHDPASDGRFNVEHRIIRRDGSIRSLITRGRTFFEGEGGSRHPVRTVGAVVDITERERAREERAALELQLAQSQKMEAVGQLTGGVAHDFNNLLGVISGNLELLGEAFEDREDLRELLQTALRATDRGVTLTRSLLAFARKQPLEPRTIDINGLMREMGELLRRTVPENIEFRLVGGAGIWPCEADPGQLQNVLLNLVVNAQDAMPNGGRLTIETGNARLDDDYAAAHAEVTPGQYVMLAVSDTGKGIPPELLTRVFEPFFTTKDVGKGTGLGLSMVYGFVKQSRGHVKIYSEVGQGTTVRVYLPRAAETADQAAAPAAPRDLSGRGETILMVEDDPDMRTLARALLHSLGYEVLDAEGAEEALRLLGSQRISLLLTDVVLRGDLNGPQLAEKALRLSPGLRVLYMSGYTENAILHQGRLDPGVHLLQKPFRKRDLAAKVRAALEEEVSP